MEFNQCVTQGNRKTRAFIIGIGRKESTGNRTIQKDMRQVVVLEPAGSVLVIRQTSLGPSAVTSVTTTTNNTSIGGCVTAANHHHHQHHNAHDNHHTVVSNNVTTVSNDHNQNRIVVVRSSSASCMTTVSSPFRT